MLQFTARCGSTKALKKSILSMVIFPFTKSAFFVEQLYLSSSQAAIHHKVLRKNKMQPSRSSSGECFKNNSDGLKKISNALLPRVLM
jgi:hypothetical protein